MAGRRVHFVMSEDLVARIDAALVVGVSRGEFVRRAVERALGEPDSALSVGRNPAPAEQPATLAEFDATLRRAAEGLEFARSSSQAKRDVAPIPKGKSS